MILGVCTEGAKIFQFMGHLLTYVKIIIPIILIVIGITAFVKAMLAQKDEEISKTAKSMLWKFIIAVVVFFIPSIVNILFSLVSNEYDNSESKSCIQCITKPDGEYCTTAVRYSENN